MAPYDFNNHRVTRNDGTNTKSYLYYGNQVLEEQQNGKRLALYGWDGQGLISRNDKDGRSLFYLWDGLGSAIGIMDSTGKLVQNYEYSAYGENLSGKDAVNEFRYVGRLGGQQDDDTGFIYMWNRWYDANVGGWLSEDTFRGSSQVNLYGYCESVGKPAGNLYEYAESVGKPSLNAYAHCDNNPINFVDPLGLFSVYDQPFTNLEWLRLTRGLPEEIVIGNGPEFISVALDQWAWERKVKLRFIRHRSLMVSKTCKPLVPGNTISRITKAIVCSERILNACSELPAWKIK